MIHNIHVDGEHFESLVREHKDAVYRQMVRVCGHREDAEDALANALLLAFKASDQLSSDKAFRTWLGTIGTRVCRKMRHHPAMEATLEYAETRNLVDAHGEDFDLAIVKGCVKDAVATLPELYQRVYNLCELEERSVAEAAAELRITPAAAKSRLLRARKLIREHLDHSICAS